VLCDAKPSRAIVGVFTDDCNKAASVLYETLSDEEYSATFSPTRSAFMYSKRDEKIDGHVFDWWKVHISSVALQRDFGFKIQLFISFPAARSYESMFLKIFV
jgi:hypothetical protein